ncbi:isoprenylcysteine carboxylmethyltransferase family protein [Alsobacter sp. KACC 23698]|uniref:Isoprenylcysteine carboxylmethyltransferase family protein n=1 Tax=Alsobacter sp. KACC 23698 TaxID=3149229 RepID=A0AAU7JAF7_9HYPH
MTSATILLLALTGQRLAELAWARSNTTRLIARGALELAPGHYPLIVAFHAAWLAGLWLMGRDQPIWTPAAAAFATLQGLRLWVLATLGRRWTTRILVVPGESLVKRGPYRLFRHPNYMIVAAEIAVAPLALHMPGYAAVASVIHAGVLAIRIREENMALASFTRVNTV